MTRLASAFGAAAVLATTLAVAAPAPAAADPCRPLLDSFITYLQGNGNHVQFHHTTNYQANNYWSSGHSWGFLQRSPAGPILTGTVNRTWVYDGRTEAFSIEFYPDGSARFAGQYGPYPTTCYNGKFLTVDTGDSFETFTFTKGGLY